MRLGGIRYEGEGGSKRHPKDTPHARIGQALALSRALRDLADDLEQDANRLIDSPPLWWSPDLMQFIPSVDNEWLRVRGGGTWRIEGGET